jgi:soluble lytic murein transglycosylase-like protein
MKRAATLFALLATAAAGPSPARADYAVLRWGVRLHITSFERAGDHMRLSIAGGVVEVAADDVVSIEAEENFQANPPAPPASGHYEDLIHAAAGKHGVDERLIARVIAEESHFNPRAVSPKRAQGLMQLLPKTAALYSVANAFDPAQNIDAGTRYLKDLLERYRGNFSLALAAYNAGPKMVERYRGIPPFPETQHYVRQITTKLPLRPADTSANDNP